MIYLYPAISLGILIGLAVGYWECRKLKGEIGNLEFDKEMLSEFNERLIRERDQYLNVVSEEEDWPEVIGQ